MAATEVEAGEGGGPVVRLTAPDEEEEIALKPCGCRHPCGCEKPCTFTELKICVPTIAILAFTVFLIVAIIPYGLKTGWKRVLAGNRLDALREKHGIPDGPIPFALLLEDQTAKEAEEAADAAMEAAIARDSG